MGVVKVLKSTGSFAISTSFDSVSKKLWGKQKC